MARTKLIVKESLEQQYLYCKQQCANTQNTVRVCLGMEIKQNVMDSNQNSHFTKSDLRLLSTQ